MVVTSQFEYSEREVFVFSEEPKQLKQRQQTRASKVSRWIVALETDHLPVRTERRRIQFIACNTKQ